jgi:hypothetical protein
MRQCLAAELELEAATELETADSQRKVAAVMEWRSLEVNLRRHQADPESAGLS